jgi:Zn finger protein HypA/HybF involved in hydrogenase expression
MTNSPAAGAPSEQSVGDVPKVRQCLRCQDTFHSEWAGERICPGCKSTAAWRKGVPQQTYPVGKRR